MSAFSDFLMAIPGIGPALATAFTPRDILPPVVQSLQQQLDVQLAAMQDLQRSIALAKQSGQTAAVAPLQAQYDQHHANAEALAEQIRGQGFNPLGGLEGQLKTLMVIVGVGVGAVVAVNLWSQSRRR